MKILVLNGPNLNMLGIREPGIYGSETYRDLLEKIAAHAQTRGVSVDFFQSNHEGALVDRIQEAYGNTDGIVINPGAYTHTSIALLDAVKAVGIPTVEVHISDVARREPFRSVSYIRAACVGSIIGHGTDGYLEAMDLLIERSHEK
ncbi:MAG: type II 3-dehydroquinate dehydratase [Angelakisella sp.]|nr:type II 3-dehydroquinate dehydratase [Angelakisella sp.]